MRPQPIMVRLGNAEWRLRPLTLKQIQEIEPLLQNSDQGSIAAAIGIIAVALMRDHPGAAESLREIEADAQEIGSAMSDILRLGGFIARGDDTEPGETKAGADSISASSTPA